METIIDISGKPKKGDVLVYDGKKFTIISKEIFLDQVITQQNEIDFLKKEVKTLKGQILCDEGKITMEDFLNGNY